MAEDTVVELRLDQALGMCEKGETWPADFVLSDGMAIKEQETLISVMHTMVASMQINF